MSQPKESTLVLRLRSTRSYEVLPLNPALSVLVVSTEEEELLAVCDEVIVMRHGRCSGRRHDAAVLDNVALRRLALETDPAHEALPDPELQREPSV